MSKNNSKKDEITVYVCTKQMGKIIDDLVAMIDYCHTEKIQHFKFDLRFLGLYYDKKDFIEAFVKYYNEKHPYKAIFWLNDHDLEITKRARFTFLELFEKRYEVVSKEQNK